MASDILVQDWDHLRREVKAEICPETVRDDDGLAGRWHIGTLGVNSIAPGHPRTLG
jgi:hypothetical protein